MTQSFASGLSGGKPCALAYRLISRWVGGAADENAAAPGRAGVLLVGYQQVRAADPLDGVPQLLRSVGFQPGGAMAQHNPADRAAVFRNTHKQIPPGTGKTMISFFRR